MKRALVSIILVFGFIAVSLLGDKQVVAKEWNPVRPISVLVQYPAGGSTDITARIIAKNAEETFGQPVLVVNKPGGGGTIAHTEVASARPDGYTTLLANVPNMLTDKELVKGITYDINSFKPIIMFAADPIILFVRKGSELDKPLKEFVDYVKARPGKILFGQPGQWGINEFARVIIENALGVHFQRVPYGGGADAVKALLSGEVDTIVTFYGDARVHIESGTFKALAVADHQRLKFVPEVRTFKEEGYEVNVTSWRVLVCPPKTPDEIVRSIHDAFKNSMDKPNTKDLLEKAGINIKYMGTQESRKFLANEYEMYHGIIQRLGLKPQ